jgi:hypothetical protein
MQLGNWTATELFFCTTEKFTVRLWEEPPEMPSIPRQGLHQMYVPEAHWRLIMLIPLWKQQLGETWQPWHVNQWTMHCKPWENHGKPWKMIYLSVVHWWTTTPATMPRGQQSVCMEPPYYRSNHGNGKSTDTIQIYTVDKCPKCWTSIPTGFPGGVPLVHQQWSPGRSGTWFIAHITMVCMNFIFFLYVNMVTPTSLY